eukprot:gene17527-24296_t
MHSSKLIFTLWLCFISKASATKSLPPRKIRPTIAPTSVVYPTVHTTAPSICIEKFIISTHIEANYGCTDYQFDKSGNPYYIGKDQNVVCSISPTGSATVIAGQQGLAASSPTDINGDGGRAESALLNNPWNMVFDSIGNMYISDNIDNKIRKIASETNIITTVAGTGQATFSGDGGSAIYANIYSPKGLYMDTSDRLYVAVSLNHRIQRIDLTTGIIITCAGASLTSNDGRYSGDNGKATSAYLNTPTGVWGDSVGNILIADTSNHLIRKVTVSTGIITTVAGYVASGAGLGGYNGDGMAATSSKLLSPSSIWIDTVGNYYISDQGNNLIRKLYATSGILVNLVGTPQLAGYSGDNGPSTIAILNSPCKFTGDTKGNYYVADYGNNRIRKLTPSDTNTTSSTSCPTANPSSSLPSSNPSTSPTSLPTTNPSSPLPSSNP